MIPVAVRAGPDSTLLPLGERVGLGTVDGEDLRQAGDPEDLEQALLVADQAHRAVVGPDLLQPPHQDSESGRVEEVDLLHVDHEVVFTIADQLGDLVSQARGRVDVDLAADLDDGVTILATGLE